MPVIHIIRFAKRTGVWKGHAFCGHVVVGSGVSIPWKEVLTRGLWEGGLGWGGFLRRGGWRGAGFAVEGW